MNVKELNEGLLRVLNETKEVLLEFALPHKTLINKIEDKTTKIFEHLCKIIGFGKNYPQDIHHWIAEVCGLLGIVKVRVKANNKSLSPERISQIMLSVYSDVKEFSAITGDLYLEYGYSDILDSQIYSKIKQILPTLIDYIQKLKEDERPDLNIVSRIILGEENEH